MYYNYFPVNFEASNSIIVMTVLKTGIKVIVWVYKHSMRKVTCPNTAQYTPDTF